MGEDRYFHKAWGVCKQMVRDRGYSLSPDYEKLSKIDINYLLDNNTLNMIGTRANDEKIFIRFINMTKTKVSYLQGIVEEIQKQHAKTTIILILKKKVSSIIKKLETRGNFNVQIFHSKVLLMNPTEYSLVPIHIKLSHDEAREVLTKYNILCKSQLPLLLPNDPIVKYYNFKKDDIIKIVKKARMTYEIQYNATAKKLSTKEVSLEKFLIETNVIHKKKSNIDRRELLKAYVDENNADIIRYRYVK